MNARRFINDLLGLVGYRVVRAEPNLVHEVARGRYDWLREYRIATILDVGANTGQFSTKARVIFPQAIIHAFEPVQSCYTQLLQLQDRLAPLVCHPYALGDQDGPAIIHRHRASASSSLLNVARRHREAFPEAVAVADEQIEVRRLDSIAPRLDLRSPILLKIDVQGFELAVLEGARTTLASVGMAIIETSMVPMYEGQALFDEVYRFMRDHGFKYISSFEQIRHPETGETLQEDSMFVHERLTR